VEEGWPQAHPDGYGKLGLVRGTLDGTQLNSQFPIANRLKNWSEKTTVRYLSKMPMPPKAGAFRTGSGSQP